MNAKTKIYAKILTHLLLAVVFISILLSPNSNFELHTKLPFLLLFCWLIHFYLNKQIIFSYLQNKIKGKEIALKINVSFLLLILIITTLLMGLTMQNGEFIPFISEDFAYERHGNFALICLALLFLHLVQNRKSLLYLWKNIFKVSKK